MFLRGTRNRRNPFGILSMGMSGERCGHRREEEIKTLLQDCEGESESGSSKKHGGAANCILAGSHFFWRSN